MGNISLNLPAQYSSTSSVSWRNQFVEERRKIDPIRIPKESYHELEAEIFRSKIHLTSNTETVVDGKPSSSEDVSLEHALQWNQNDLVPEVHISTVDAELSGEDKINGTTVVTAPEQSSNFAEDQVGISLQNDATDKHDEVDILPEGHEDLPAVVEAGGIVVK